MQIALPLGSSFLKHHRPIYNPLYRGQKERYINYVVRRFLYKSLFSFSQQLVVVRAISAVVVLGVGGIALTAGVILTQAQQSSEPASQPVQVQYKHEPQHIAIVQQHTLLPTRSIPNIAPEPTGITATIQSNSKPAPPPQPVFLSRQAQTQDISDSDFIRPTTGRVSQWLHGNNAIDIANACGTQVIASNDGIVSASVNNNRWNRGYGNYLVIDHSDGTSTLYAHLQNIAVVQDQYVLQGSVVGHIGSTGLSTGCHLHFEVHGAKNFVR